MWAAIGNLLRLYSVLYFIGIGLIVIGLSARGWILPGVVGPMVASVILGLVFGILFWMAKPALISGSPFFVRWLVGLWFLLGIIFSLGLYLIVIGIAYLFTSEPEQESMFRRESPAKPRFKPPRNWQPNGRVGPSGATVYADTNRGALIGMFDSWLPVQLLEQRDGYTRVIAASGEAGWIDDRTVTEGV